LEGFEIGLNKCMCKRKHSRNIYRRKFHRSDIHRRNIHRLDIHRRNIQRMNIHRRDIRRKDIHRADIHRRNRNIHIYINHETLRVSKAVTLNKSMTVARPFLKLPPNH
jgi:hypothetical protein